MKMSSNLYCNHLCDIDNCFLLLLYHLNYGQSMTAISYLCLEYGRGASNRRQRILTSQVNNTRLFLVEAGVVFVQQFSPEAAISSAS